MYVINIKVTNSEYTFQPVEVIYHFPASDYLEGIDLTFNMEKSLEEVESSAMATAPQSLINLFNELNQDLKAYLIKE